MRKRTRFKFSRLVTEQSDRIATDLVREYIDAVHSEAARHGQVMADLTEKHDDVMRVLRKKYGVPNGMKVHIDSTHLAEHGMMFIVSTDETEEYEVIDAGAVN